MKIVASYQNNPSSNSLKYNAENLNNYKSIRLKLCCRGIGFERGGTHS
jgi:hypothetical protein